ncbi:alpha/beta-hydrolase [Flagelloscypha sp. PMI_526]|nr:alpha/beta-hydrolase [Flagelloscypha sp. PMI_526]
MSLLVSLSFLSFLAALFISSVSALPVRVRQDDGFRTLTPDEVDSTFLRPALFARFAYCDPANVPDLSCGGPCEPLKDDVEVLTSGGDGGALPHFLVAHDRSDNSIVVAHEGTTSDDATSILNDLQFGLVDLNTAKFPQFVDSGAEVHSGFQDAFYVQDALVSKNSTKVLITGHSLGGAIALMDAMMFKQILDPSIDIKTITFGTPRGGNQEWADLVDKNLGDNQMFMTNRNDIVPQLPPAAILGFQHAKGEVHVSSDDNAAIVSCPGQALFSGSYLTSTSNNTKGPYFDDISFGHSQCPLVKV